jgi:opacity protein-like surface antigen
MLRKLALAVVFLALGSVAALAADFNGKWTGAITTQRGTQNLTFDFHVNGSALTGKITTQRGDADITDGKIDGDTVTFTQKVTMGGNDLTFTYTGKIDGDTIHFTRAADGRPPANFDAKRGGGQ